MQIFRVGGSVRDELLGLPVVDRDWVVIGETPESMITAGFQPVGKDFPVFLHPVTHEEYALARTERKTGPGYKGFAVQFSPDVTLEEDLARRDLTVNAMALQADGTLVDPFDGARDLVERVLRHVTAAFSEDPVRILRVARFSARFETFTIAPETMSLMQAMVRAGEVDALVPERVWQELSRGLMERHPSRMLAVLEATGAAAVLLPAWAALDAKRRAACGEALDRSALQDDPLPVRVAIWFADLGRVAAEAACQALKAPNECRDLAGQVASQANLQPAWLTGASAQGLYDLLAGLDAWRRPERVEALIRATAARTDTPVSSTGAERLRLALAATRQVDQATIAAGLAGQPLAIRDAIAAARLAAIRQVTG